MLVDERRESPGIGVRNCVSIGPAACSVARVPEHDGIDDEAQRAELIFLPLFVSAAVARRACRRTQPWRHCGALPLD